MTPLDDAPRTEDDVTRTTAIDAGPPDDPVPGLGEIWSSIGPGRVPGRGEGPPTIRPADLVTSMPTHPVSTPGQDRILPQPSEKDLPVTDTAPPTGLDSTSEALREELRIGVRMLQALDSQFTRAESLIRREEDTATRAEEALDRLSRRLESIDTGAAVAAGIDAESIERTATDAIARITATSDDVARRLHERLERFVALDTRLDELDATLRTVERRLTRIDDATPAPATFAATTAAPATGTPTTSTASSGSLSVEPRASVVRTAPSATTGATTRALPGAASDETIAAMARLTLLIDRGEEVRKELRRDLEAICTASATLVEVVEQAGATEQTLRGTLEVAGGTPRETPSTETAAGWSVASILRRLADEFDAGLADKIERLDQSDQSDQSDQGPRSTPLSPQSLSTPVASPLRAMPAGMTPTHPIELELEPGSGAPIRREPLRDEVSVADVDLTS